MARPDTSDVAAPSTEHRQADMVATLSRNAWHGITEAEQKRRTVAAGKAHADDKAEMQERRLGRKLTFGEKLRLQYVATLAENTEVKEDKKDNAHYKRQFRQNWVIEQLKKTEPAHPQPRDTAQKLLHHVAVASSSEHRQADVLAVHDSSRVVIASVRFYKAFSGEELFLPRQVCTKVRKESEAEWYFQWIAELVQRPQGFFRFVVTDVGGDSHVLEWKLRICERSHTPMTNLTKEDDGTVWIAVVEKDAPRDYADFKGLCVCDFGGCCKFCGDDVPSRCCGTNGCCRAGNCGHECCEKTRSADAAPSES